jgi:hypothetical protein
MDTTRKTEDIDYYMHTIKIVDEINQDRRRFFVAAAGAVAATQLGVIGSAAAQGVRAKMPAIKPGTNTSFGRLKQLNAGVLSVGYTEAGPADGPAVILLHGWPYDIHSFVDVAPLLASAGYHVFVPYLRGYGTTHFLSSETVRNGQPSLRPWRSMPSPSWMLSRSKRRSSPVLTGERAPPTSLRRSGRNVAKLWFP